MTTSQASMPSPIPSHAGSPTVVRGHGYARAARLARRLEAGRRLSVSTCVGLAAVAVVLALLVLLTDPGVVVFASNGFSSKLFVPLHGPVYLLATAALVAAVLLAAWEPWTALAVAAGADVLFLLSGSGLPVSACVAAGPLVWACASSDRRAAVTAAAAASCYGLVAALLPPAWGGHLIITAAYQGAFGTSVAVVAVPAVLGLAAGLVLPAPGRDRWDGVVRFRGRPSFMPAWEAAGVAGVAVGLLALAAVSPLGVGGLPRVARATLGYGAGTLVLLVVVAGVVLAAAASPWRPYAGVAVGVTASTIMTLAVVGTPVDSAPMFALLIYVAARRRLRWGVAVTALLVPAALAGRTPWTTGPDLYGLISSSRSVEWGGSGSGGFATGASSWRYFVVGDLWPVLVQVAMLPLLALVVARLVTAWLAIRQERLALAARAQAVDAAAAVTAERARIARELHDVVAHHVSLVAVRAETAPYTVGPLEPAAGKAFADIADRSRAALGELRGILGVLRRAEDSGPELAPAPGLDDVETLVSQARAAGSRVEYEPLAPGVVVPEPVALAAYRIAQEALSNARRHAPLAAVAVRLAVADGRLAVDVENGPGPDPTAEGAAGFGPAGFGPAGFGLAGMHERAASVGGTVSAGPTAAGGFRVSAVLPLGPGR